jgi:hypothetical protein
MAKRPLRGGGEIGCHSGEPGLHSSILFAAEPDEDLQDRVAVTEQRAPDRL